MELVRSVLRFALLHHLPVGHRCRKDFQRLIGRLKGLVLKRATPRTRSRPSLECPIPVSISGGTVILFRLNEEHLWENCTLHVTAFRKAVLAVWDIAGCAV